MIMPIFVPIRASGTMLIINRYQHYRIPVAAQATTRGLNEFVGFGLKKRLLE